jgi:hypothetical protein
LSLPQLFAEPLGPILIRAYEEAVETEGFSGLDILAAVVEEKAFVGLHAGVAEDILKEIGARLAILYLIAAVRMS